MMLPKKRTHNCNTLDASSWRFSKDTRNILTCTSRGQLVLFAKNTLSFLLLALGSQDNIPRVSLACLSPRRVLDSKWNFSLTPFRRPALANFSQLFLFLFSKWGWLAIAIFQPESHRTKSLQCSKHLTRQFCALFSHWACPEGWFIHTGWGYWDLLANGTLLTSPRNTLPSVDLSLSPVSPQIICFCSFIWGFLPSP